jgi:hypothetical protein
MIRKGCKKGNLKFKKFKWKVGTRTVSSEDRPVPLKVKQSRYTPWRCLGGEEV